MTSPYRFGTHGNSSVIDEDKLVHNPTHYNQHGIECIDAIQASMTVDEFKGMLKGNVLKYLWRYAYKDKPVQDLEKAGWYLARLVQKVKADE